MFMRSNASYTIGTLINMVRKGQIILAEGISYSEPWNVREMSRFMESVMIDFPLGEIILLGHPAKSPLRLVDGARRLAAMCLFSGAIPPWPYFHGSESFALTDVPWIPALEGLGFARIARTEMSLYENTGVGVSFIFNGVIPLAPAQLRARIHTPSEG